LDCSGQRTGKQIGGKKKKELKEPEWGRLLFVAAFSD